MVYKQTDIVALLASSSCRYAKLFEDKRIRYFDQGTIKPFQGSQAFELEDPFDQDFGQRAQYGKAYVSRLPRSRFSSCTAPAKAAYDPLPKILT